MLTRRTLLKWSTAGSVCLAGCGEDTMVKSDRGLNDSSHSATSTTSEAVLDIRDYGANVDGESDDTRAVQDAIDDAVPGDVVAFPAGTTVVSADKRSRSGAAAIRIDGDTHPRNLTLRGAGNASVVRMDGGHESNHKVFEVRVGSGIEELELADLTVDGRSEDQIQPAGMGGWNFNVAKAADGTVVPDVTFRNVWSRNANQNGFRLAHGGCTLVSCTATDCQLHGFVADSWGDSRNLDPPIAFRRCYAARNGLYGLDCSGGKTIAVDSVFENNGQGTKTTPEVVSAVYRRCRLAENETFGYNRPKSPTETGQRANVRFSDVLSEGNGHAGLRFGFDTDYVVDAILARRNSGGSEKSANVLIRDNATVDATLVLSYEATKGTGLRYGSSQPAHIETYVHAGNPDGAVIRDHEGLDITHTLTRRAYREREQDATIEVLEDIRQIDQFLGSGLGRVPTASEVGAGSGA